MKQHLLYVVFCDYCIVNIWVNAVHSIIMSDLPPISVQKMQRHGEKNCRKYCHGTIVM
jgi:hypothetical protein